MAKLKERKKGKAKVNQQKIKPKWIELTKEILCLDSESKLEVPLSGMW